MSRPGMMKLQPKFVRQLADALHRDGEGVDRLFHHADADRGADGDEVAGELVGGKVIAAGRRLAGRVTAVWCASSKSARPTVSDRFASVVCRGPEIGTQCCRSHTMLPIRILQLCPHTYLRLISHDAARRKNAAAAEGCECVVEFEIKSQCRSNEQI